jgi:hypothetical protein
MTSRHGTSGMARHGKASYNTQSLWNPQLCRREGPLQVHSNHVVISSTLESCMLRHDLERVLRASSSCVCRVNYKYMNYISCRSTINAFTNTYGVFPFGTRDVVGCPARLRVSIMTMVLVCPDDYILSRANYLCMYQ